MKRISQKKIRKLMDARAENIVAGMFEHIKSKPILTRLHIALRIVFRRPGA